MTKARVFGNDQPFMAWLRRCDELRSGAGFVTTDVDLLAHSYVTSVDGVGTRELQSLMFVEVKTGRAKVSRSQRDTLFKQHMLSVTDRPVKILGQTIRHFGVSFCYLSGLTPDESDCIRWGRFDRNGDIRGTNISRDQLIELLGFRLHPETLTSSPFRRHHKTKMIVCEEITNLGFTIDREVIHRS